MQRRDFLRSCVHCALAAALSPLAVPLCASAGQVPMQRGLLGLAPTPYQKPLKNKAVQCLLCPRNCVMSPGQRGHCEVRENRGGELQTLVYGNPCAVNVDPIEKKPFYHVLPTTKSFSIATAGCNLDCVFCQNHEISQARPDDTLNYKLSAQDVARYAQQYGCDSVAHTYVEPTIFMEYMLDIGRELQGTEVLNVMHSSGYVSQAPLADLCQVLDAACIDLKGFSEEYYREMTGGRLAPVLDSLQTLHQAGVHLELVTLLVPGKNDDPETLARMCRWIVEELGPDTPLHFSRFYPMYRLQHVAPTPVARLETARDVALAAGLRYVYIGNVAGHVAQNTVCPECETLLIQRDGYSVRVASMEQGVCTVCGLAVPGIWE